MSFDIHLLDKFPKEPGVYLMKNRQGEVLYVGKAKNLKQRVKQYFSPGGDERLMIPYLVAKVDHVDTIVVFSEKEALLLENNLIKEHQPIYNALLKDDKSYIALKINNRHPWPALSLVRYKGKPKADGLYFGPYTNAEGARQTFDLLNRLFPLRQCSDQELLNRTRPCILYDMKRCIAPCVGKCTKEEYDHHVQRIIKFLKGQDKEILKELYTDMHEAAEALAFERAAALLKIIRQIEKTLQEQNVDRPFGFDCDAVAIFRQGDEVVLAQLIFREGKLRGARHYNFSRIVEDDDELLASFLLQHYKQQEELPHEILLPIALPNAEVLSDILSENKRRKVVIFRPLRGDKCSLIEMALANAKAFFTKEKDVQSIRQKTLLDMQEQFHLTSYPKRIECFDNSHIAGTNPVSSMVVFTDGVKDSKHYRKYHIKHADVSDDYGAMKEILTRRYIRAKEENSLPDLIIVDGGKGHLNLALKVLEELNIATINVISLAKEEGRHDKGMSVEQVFLPRAKEAVHLKRTSSVLFLLQQIRDEAHRAALTFHRQVRSKKTLTSALDDISGIGPIKRKALLKHFGSAKKVFEAPEDELRKVKGMTQATIDAIRKRT